MTNNEHASPNANELNNALDNSSNEVNNSEASGLEETTRSLINAEQGETQPVEADNTSENTDTVSVGESALEAETAAMVQPETGGNVPAEETGEKGKNRKRKVLIAGVAATVAVLVAVGGGLGYYRYHAVAEQKEACNTAVASITKDQQSLTALLKSDKVVQALKVTDKQVLKDDAHVIADLKTAVESAQEKVSLPSCQLDYWDFTTDLSEQTGKTAQQVKSRKTAVTQEVEQVQKAVSAKTLNDAKAKLQTTVDAASKLLSDSDGKVQDNATRDTLKKAIDAANKLLKENKETDPAKYATKALDDAIGGVNASVEAKRKADEEAAAAAAAAQAAAQAQRAYTPTYNGGGYSGGGYSGGNNGGGSYTPPANNGGGSGSSGGSTSWEDLKKSIPHDPDLDCHQGEYCPIG